MLKLNYLFIALLLPFLAAAQSGKYVIKGKLGNYNSPAKAYLFSTYPGDESIKDSSILKDGVFEFTGTVTFPRQAMIIVNPLGNGSRIGKRDNTYDFYVEPGLTTLNATDKLRSADFKGGPWTSDLNRFKAIVKPVEDQAVATYRERALTPKDKQDEEFNSRIRKAMAEQDSAYKTAYLNFIKDNLDSPISIVALRRYSDLVGETINPEIIEPLYLSLSRRVREKSELGISYGKQIQFVKTLGIGKIAPEISQIDTAGRKISLSDFKGKYVLIDFWASWCVPCRKESPFLVNAFRKFKNKNFTILAVSLDVESAKEAWLKAIRMDGTGSWFQTASLTAKRNPAADVYSIFAIPKNYLIDPSGKIVAKNIHGEAIEKTLRELIK